MAPLPLVDMGTYARDKKLDKRRVEKNKEWKGIRETKRRKRKKEKKKKERKNKRKRDRGRERDIERDKEKES